MKTMTPIKILLKNVTRVNFGAEAFSRAALNIMAII
jgi:hypothetical protein